MNFWIGSVLGCTDGGRGRLRRWLGTAGVLLVLPAAATAQIPGDELPGMSRVRNEYLAITYGDVKELLAAWQEHHRNGDADKLAGLFTEDGLYSPAEGWYVQGRSAVGDTLAARLPQVRGYHTSLLDFTASGSLVYYLGRVSYRIEGPSPEDVSGMFVMVLYQHGRHWRIRSYLERPNAVY